jgi:hypothetical protein
MFVEWHPPKLVVRPLASDYFAEEVANFLLRHRRQMEAPSKYFTCANFQESIRVSGIQVIGLLSRMILCSNA